MCPYFMSYGMSWDEFWNAPIERMGFYWQKRQYEKEARNEELWLQGLYIKDAIVSSFEKTVKYPGKPIRITPMTKHEQELESKRMVEEFREKLNEIKRLHDMRKGVKAQ